MTVKTVKDLINEGIRGRYVLVRSNSNVPLKNGIITDPGRIDASLSVLSVLIDAGAKVVVMARLDHLKGETKPRFSLVPAAEALSERPKQYVVLAGHISDEDAHGRANGLTEGDVLLLGNVRFDPRETSKGEAERAGFAAELAVLIPGGASVPDSFGVVRRVQISVFDVVKGLPHHAGNLVQAEFEVLHGVAETPEKPYTVVLGGSEVSDKLGVTEALAPKINSLVIGSGMCFTFLATRGYAVGSFLLQEEMISTRRDSLDRHGGKIILPTDVAVTDKFAADAKDKVAGAAEIPEGQIGLDIGPASVEAFGKVLTESKTVFWNGPMGVFEMEVFAADAREVVQAIIDATTNNGCFSVVGDGDSAVAVHTLGSNEEGFSHISTGDGASLEFLEGKTLPDISVLED